MDAVKFLVELNRMCKYETREQIGRECEKCQFYIDEIRCSLENLNFEEVKKAVEIVEQWSKEHPVKTYKDDFLEKFPKTNFPREYLYRKNKWCDLYNYGDCDKNDNAKCENCWDMEVENDQ